MTATTNTATAATAAPIANGDLRVLVGIDDGAASACNRAIKSAEN